jgi:signal transduction histidine kinase
VSRRIVLAIVAVAALAEALFALPVAVAIRHRQADQDGRELTQLAALAATRVGDGRLLTRTPKHGPEPEQQLGLYNRSGDRIDGTGPVHLEPVVRPALDDRIVDLPVNGYLVVAVPVVTATKVSGVVRTAEPLSAGASRVRNSWLALAGLAGLVLVAAAAAAVGLARRLTRPLARLGQDAASIGKGDFTVTTPKTGLPEIDRVGVNLTRTAGRVGALLAREQAFTADASHQLRSPLTGLRLTIEAELAHPRPDPRQALTLALADVERLETTIDDLLALARDTPGLRLPVDLVDVVEEIERRWADGFRAKGRRLVTELPPGLPQPTLSQAALLHVLDVLVDNARVHAKGTVEVGARVHPGAVTLRVSDEGPGIADAQRVFERGHSEAGSTGIGLALARRLAEAEGGRLRLVGNERGGSTFELTLPVREATAR